MRSSQRLSDVPILDQIRRHLKVTLKLTDAEAAAIGPTSTPLDVRGWTSLGHVQLILEIENAFGVSFEPEEMVALASVDSIVRALESRGVR
jgi:acyl carrier protein